MEDPFSLGSRIINRNSGKCLDVVNRLLVQNTCDGRGSELFIPNSGTRNLMDIRSLANGLGDCIDVPGGSGALSLQIQTAPCIDPTCPQHWVVGLQDAAKQLWVLLRGS